MNVEKALVPMTQPTSSGPEFEAAAQHACLDSVRSPIVRRLLHDVENGAEHLLAHRESDDPGHDELEHAVAGLLDALPADVAYELSEVFPGVLKEHK